jgi:hypothetical protein
MNIIQVRSPYIISVNESGQLGSKIEIFIWNKGTTEPTVATYSLSKKIPSTSQVRNDYNISTFVKEYIEIINAVAVSTPTIETNNYWTNVKIKRYKEATLNTYTLLDTTSYIALNGFTNYLDGVNKTTISETLALSNQSINILYQTGEIPYVNLLLNRNVTYSFLAQYYNAADGLIHTETIITSGANEIFNYKVPLVYTGSTYIKIVSNSIVLYTYNTKLIEECKYTPIVCSFINRQGGWQFLTFFKSTTNSINVTSTSFKLSPEAVNYNIYKGQSKAFNINGNQSIKLNTGFVDENYSELITDLLLSESILLDNKPVKIKTQSTELKNSLKDKLINYEIEFEYNYDLINNVI